MLADVALHSSEGSLPPLKVDLPPSIAPGGLRFQQNFDAVIFLILEEVVSLFGFIQR